MKKISIIMTAIIGILFTSFLIALPYRERSYTNGETETNLQIIPKQQQFGAVLLGSSHARMLSRETNHQVLERLLGKRVINLAQGGNRESIRNQFAYLNYFFMRGNSTVHVVYLLDPYVFYRHNLLSNPQSFNHEPLRLDFLNNLLQMGEYDAETITTYISSFSSSKYIEPTRIQQSSPSARFIEQRSQQLFRENPTAQTLNQDLRDLAQIAKISQMNHARFTVIIPPTLLPLSGQAKVIDKAVGQLQKQYRFQFVDLGTKLDPKYFLDADHLNDRGRAEFINNYLRPILTH